jgi:hypothetical protein
MSQVKSIEYNDDGTINIIDDTGTKFTSCYLTSNEHDVCSANETDAVDCKVSYNVEERLSKLKPLGNSDVGAGKEK